MRRRKASRPQGAGQAPGTALRIKGGRQRESREGRKERQRKMAKPMLSDLDLVSTSQCSLSFSTSLHLLLSLFFSVSLCLSNV